MSVQQQVESGEGRPDRTTLTQGLLADSVPASEGQRVACLDVQGVDRHSFKVT